MTTIIISIILWTIIAAIVFPVIWIKTDPIDLRFKIICTLIVVLAPGILLWLLFLYIVKWTCKDEKKNKIISSIENFYFKSLD